MSALATRLAITGIGLNCSVGQNAIAACAAIRAGICRFADWPHISAIVAGEDIGLVVAATVPDLGDRDWIEKAEDLACLPLAEAIWSAGLPELAEPVDDPNWGLYVGVPETDRAGVDPENLQELTSDIEESMFLGFEPAVLEIIPEGHVGAFHALRRAAEDLHSGQVGIAVVGGLDSALESEHLQTMLMEDRIRTELTPVGMTPGEAAAFFVVETEEGAAARGADVWAHVLPVHTTAEAAAANGEPASGAAYAEALRASVAELSCDPKDVQRIISDVNGERSRFREWALADAQALNDLAPDWRLWHSADCIGDVGAASGAVFVCMAVQAFRRGYAVGDAIVLGTASMSGHRAVTSVISAQAG